ncbi:hypothetical protein C8R42DRAFT_407103 [Lentinula raphanica]|nr:hypothetical protein C8R42DRAFT_407103 [Lentinula raphanica]
MTRTTLLPTRSFIGWGYCRLALMTPNPLHTFLDPGNPNNTSALLPCIALGSAMSVSCLPLCSPIWHFLIAISSHSARFCFVWSSMVTIHTPAFHLVPAYHSQAPLLLSLACTYIVQALFTSTTPYLACIVISLASCLCYRHLVPVNAIMYGHSALCLACTYPLGFPSSCLAFPCFTWILHVPWAMVCFSGPRQVKPSHDDSSSGVS